jgi:hypothetical protein
MANYNVRINLNSISLTLDAEDENHAFELAYEIAMGQTQYDLLKWADYEIEVADVG